MNGGGEPLFRLRTQSCCVRVHRVVVCSEEYYKYPRLEATTAWVGCHPSVLVLLQRHYSLNTILVALSFAVPVLSSLFSLYSVT